MKLSSSQRQYLMVSQCLIPFVINFALNGFFAWVMFRGMSPIPTWGLKLSAGLDLIGTCFFLPAITCLIGTLIIRRHIHGGVVAPVSGLEDFPYWLRPFRRPLVTRAVLFGLVGVGLIGSLLATTLFLAGLAQFEFKPFLWFKALFSGVFGGLVTPIIGIVALAEADLPARMG